MNIYIYNNLYKLYYNVKTYKGMHTHACVNRNYHNKFNY
jgi:hypothetical protein